MTTLLSRLQSATGPSRELDAEIALANGWKLINDAESLWRSPTGRYDWAPLYTESIDAALTLVPSLDKAEGALWLKLGQFAGARGSGKEGWTADIWGVKGDKEVKWWGIHNSPAIALLIAIERAKEDSKP